MSENTNQAPTTVPEKKLTRAEKLVVRAGFLADRIGKDTEEFNQIKQELAIAEQLAGVDEGSVIRAKLGRKFSEEKDTTRVVVATVVGVKVDEDGAKQYKISHGVGFDADIAVIGAGQIVEIANVDGSFPSDVVSA